MNYEAKSEQLKDASSLAYNHMKHSGLFKVLSNEEWEAKADEWGARVFDLLERLTDAETEEMEAVA